MTVRVKPAGDVWLVTQNGITQSNHRLKKRATKKAGRVAVSGEQIVIHGANGQIQDRRRKR